MKAAELSRSMLGRAARALPFSWKRRLTKTLLLDAFPELTARLIHYMADTGEGTDVCLENGVLPMKVHYYSPVPDLQDLTRRQVWKKRSAMVGVDFREAAQRKLLQELGTKFGHECEWPKDATPDPSRFYTHNSNFSYGCAAALHTMIRSRKPRRVVEVGSGNSSRVISAALEMNMADQPNVIPNYTVIDPYPRVGTETSLRRLSKIIPKGVEEMELGFFEELDDRDILFIDSSHVVKIGSDVNFLILEVLPRLKPGVIIHFHDIPMPWEYAEVYARDPASRFFWNESYLLQAFLAFNNCFEVLLSMGFLQTEYMDEFCAAFPKFKLAENWANSGSLWMRRSK